MLKDRAKKYYLDGNFNCAETALRAIRDEYSLEIAEDDLKLVSAFGGGMGCGKTCGALCGCLAAYGKMTVRERAKEDKSFSSKCRGICKAFGDKLGSTECAELKKIYKDSENHCLETVELALEAFEEYMNRQEN